MLFLTSVAVGNFAHGQLRDQGRMPRQHSQIAILAGNLNLRRRGVDNLLFRRDDLELESIWHDVGNRNWQLAAGN